jgi:NAD dependent epimerase/dehydratase
LTVSDWKGRKVLVTGAGGFIGSHLAERLVKLGAHTRALIHYNSNGSRGWLDRSPLQSDMEIIAGDVCDPWRVYSALEGVEVVFHLAALIGIPYSYLAPHSYMKTNADGTLNILEAARRLGTKRILCTSTSEVYGSARYVPIDEDHPLQGQSPYSASKIAADKMAEAYYSSFGVPVTIVRPFNTYGPRQSNRAVIPTIITQALVGEKVRLGAVHTTRDFNFVSDTVEGFIAIASEEKAMGEVINLGSGIGISIRELAGAIGKLLGKQLILEADSQRFRPEKSEVDRLCANAAKAAGLFEWKPKVSLEEGLLLTIDWLKSNPPSDRLNEYAV